MKYKFLDEDMNLVYEDEMTEAEARSFAAAHGYYVTTNQDI